MRGWGVFRTESTQQAAVPRTASYYTLKRFKVKKKKVFLEDTTFRNRKKVSDVLGKYWILLLCLMTF